MIVWWGRKVRTRRLEGGHFNCPTCRSRQPCALMRVDRVLYVYSLIPIGHGDEIARYIQCQTCRAPYDAALFVIPSGGGEFATETWECPGCHHANLNTQFKCRRCAFCVA